MDKKAILQQFMLSYSGKSGGSSNVVTGFTYGSGTNILTLEGITSVPKNLFLCYLRGDSSDNIRITDEKCILTVSFTNNTATSGKTNYLISGYNAGNLYVDGWQDSDVTFKYENNTLTIQYYNTSYKFKTKRYYYLIEY